MSLEKASLINFFPPHDREMIGDAWDDVVALVESNPFSERMQFLFSHKDLAHKPVKNKVGRLSAPNCLGTAFFVAGVDVIGYPYHAYSFELNQHMKQPGENSDSCFLAYDHVHRRVPGAFVFSPCIHGEDWHAGIYLGQVRGEHVAFAQHGHGGSFGVETLSKNYSYPDYYIPSTLFELYAHLLA